MNFSIPTNWQRGLIPKIRQEGVEELYGKLADDFVGGGRFSFLLPHPSKSEAYRHVQEIHENGLRFNYLLNALCLDNKEFTITGQRQLHKLLDWLTELKADSVTVSVPYLLQLIKKQYPHFKVSVSVTAAVNTPERAKYWEDLGADSITLHSMDLNRNFKLLKLIRKRVSCGLQLIANLASLYDCPFYLYHNLLASHASQSGHLCQGFVVDYCIINCRYQRLINPVNFIRSDWIRPEDIHYYEELGINKIKLVDRSAPTAQIALVVKAYVNRRYDGNLVDLLLPLSQNRVVKRPGLFHIFRYLFRPLSVNVFRLSRLLKTISSINVYIDNRALDGFLKHFLENDCHYTSCQECSYCEEVAKRTVKIDEKYRAEAIVKYKGLIEYLVSGKLFKYFN